MKYAFGDPGNPNCSLKGLRLSCRITRGKGEALVEIAEDQEPYAIDNMRKMVAFLEWAITQHMLENPTIKPFQVHRTYSSFADTLRSIKAQHIQQYREAADELEQELAE